MSSTGKETVGAKLKRVLTPRSQRAEQQRIRELVAQRRIEDQQKAASNAVAAPQEEVQKVIEELEADLIEETAPNGQSVAVPVSPLYIDLTSPAPNGDASPTFAVLGFRLSDIPAPVIKGVAAAAAVLIGSFLLPKKKKSKVSTGPKKVDGKGVATAAAGAAAAGAAAKKVAAPAKKPATPAKKEEPKKAAAKKPATPAKKPATPAKKEEPKKTNKKGKKGAVEEPKKEPSFVEAIEALFKRK